MAVCTWCEREMTDKTITTCTGNGEVEFPDGTTIMAIPFKAPPPETEEEWMAKWREYREAEAWRAEKFGYPLYRDPEEDALERCREYLKRQDRCGDCGIKDGGYHHPGCDMEVCPRCKGQLISCGCLDTHEDEVEDYG